MHRIVELGSVLLLMMTASYASGKQTAKDSPSPNPPAAKPGTPKVNAPKGGVPKALPKGAARLVNPSNVASRLFRMTPEEREHQLEKLPTEQARENARKLLEWFDDLPKDQQDIQLRRLDRFAQLSPEKRAELRQLVVAANKLEGPRKNAVGRALVLLQQMNDQQREAALHSAAFEERFSPEELKIIIGLADAWMQPM